MAAKKKHRIRIRKTSVFVAEKIVWHEETVHDLLANGGVFMWKEKPELEEILVENLGEVSTLIDG